MQIASQFCFQLVAPFCNFPRDHIRVQYALPPFLHLSWPLRLPAHAQAVQALRQRGLAVVEAPRVVAEPRAVPRVHAAHALLRQRRRVHPVLQHEPLGKVHVDAFQDL